MNTLRMVFIYIYAYPSKGNKSAADDVLASGAGKKVEKSVLKNAIMSGCNTKIELLSR